jgi:hypothetical protein
VALGFALWIAATFFVALLLIGLVACAVFYGRDFLVKKGILNPRPGVPFEPQHEQVTIIDGDFERLDEEKKS